MAAGDGKSISQPMDKYNGHHVFVQQRRKIIHQIFTFTKRRRKVWRRSEARTNHCYLGFKLD